MELFFAITFILIILFLLLPFARNVEKQKLTDQSIKESDVNRKELSYGKVNYHLHGKKGDPIIVMVHGFSVPSFCWERNIPVLVAQGYQVLTYDLYGRGFSDRPNTRYDLELFVDQLDELLSALEIKQPITLVGLSMGGVIAAQFAAEHPQKIKNIALLAPFHKAVNIGPLKWPLLGKHLTYSFYIPSVVKNQMKEFVEPEQLEYWQKRYSVQMRFRGFRRAIYSTAMNLIVKDPTRSFAGLAKQNHPTLVLWGEKDQMFPVQAAPDFVKSLGSDSHFVQIDGAGHALQYEKSDQVNELLANFAKTSNV